MSTDVSFKLKEKGVDWEDTKVTLMVTYPENRFEEITPLAYQKAKEIANQFKVEVRWNFTGYYQGHYVHYDEYLKDLVGGKNNE